MRPSHGADVLSAFNVRPVAAHVVVSCIVIWHFFETSDQDDLQMKTRPGKTSEAAKASITKMPTA
jgi:hypothetical protein